MQDHIEVEDDRKLPVFIHSELDDYGLTPYEFRIYCRLSRRAGKHNEAKEGVNRMARECQISESQVRRCLDVLVKAGLIGEQQRVGQTTLYRLTNPDKWVNTTSLPAIRQSIYPTQKSIQNPSISDTPVPGTGHPCTPYTPTPVPGTPKGTPSEGTPHEGGERARAREEAPPFSRSIPRTQTPVHTTSCGRLERIEDWLIAYYRLPVTVFKNQKLYQDTALSVAEMTRDGREIAALTDFLDEQQACGRTVELRFLAEKLSAWLGGKRFGNGLQPVVMQ